MFRLLLTIALAVGGLVSQPTHGFADQTPPALSLREGLSALAKKASGVLKNNKNQKTVALADIVSKAKGNANSGPGIRRILEEEIRGQAITIDEDADYIISATYTLREQKETKLLALVIEAMLEKRDGSDKVALGIDLEVSDETKPEKKDIVRDQKIETTDMRDLTRVIGFTGRLSEHGSKAERNQEFAKQVQNPSVNIVGTRVSSIKGSPFSVEIASKKKVSDSAVAKTPKNVKGQASLEIDREELYEVTLYNDADFEVAATLFIDGIDNFYFTDDRSKDGSPAYSHYVIGPKSSATIVGWHKTSNPERKDNFLSFLVTEYGKGAASKLPQQSTGHVGVISVSFAKCYKVDDQSRPRSASETGFGPPVEQKTEVVSRKIDVAFDFVSIRYLR